MSATQVQTEKPAKYLVRNQTAGYIGVIEINHRGEELGVNIDPLGTRWMTEEEMVATARAPRDPTDNPFEEQTYHRQNPDTGAKEEFKLRPLVLETDAERFVPSNERYVPTPDAPQGAAPGIVREPPRSTAPVAGPESTGAPTPPLPPVVPSAPGPALKTQRVTSRPDPQPGLAGGSAPAGGEEEAQSWVQPPEAPGHVLSGALTGTDTPAPEAEAEAAPEPTNHPGERHVPSVLGAQAAPQTPGAVEEEHAQAVDPEIGEETGAARPPTQRQPEGEFARAEEVGSPDAPQAANDETQNGG